MMGLTEALTVDILDLSDSSHDEETGLGDRSYSHMRDSSTDHGKSLDESITETKPAVRPKYRRSSGSDTDLLKNFLKNKQPVTIIQSKDHKTTMSSGDTGTSQNITKNPQDVLKAILSVDVVAYPATMWDAYFLQWNEKNVKAHTKELEQAIRDEDYTKLRAMIKSGKILQTCNKHGESIVHLSCRRSSDELLRFLMKEGDVIVRIRDDCGRSPLHDTCWSYNDRFDIFKTLVENSPELLFIKDFRGFAPFDYIPKPKWGEWRSFLEANANFLKQCTKAVVKDMVDMETEMKLKKKI